MQSQRKNHNSDIKENPITCKTEVCVLTQKTMTIVGGSGGASNWIAAVDTLEHELLLAAKINTLSWGKEMEKTHTHTQMDQLCCLDSLLQSIIIT